MTLSGTVLASMVGMLRLMWPAWSRGQTDDPVTVCGCTVMALPPIRLKREPLADGSVTSPTALAERRLVVNLSQSNYRGTGQRIEQRVAEYVGADGVLLDWPT